MQRVNEQQQKFRQGDHGPKYMFRYPEALRLAGAFCWLTGKQRTALKYWKEGLAIGKKLGLKPDLGRISFEVAKRLSSAESRYRTLEKLGPEHYARTAREIFTEFGLELDMEEVKAWEQGHHAQN